MFNLILIFSVLCCQAFGAAFGAVLFIFKATICNIKPAISNIGRHLFLYQLDSLIVKRCPILRIVYIGTCFIIRRWM